MPNLRLNVTAQVTGGPAMTFLENLQPEGYGQISIEVPGGSTGSGKVKVRLAADVLDLLLITSTTYSDKIKLESGTGSGARSFLLTSPVLLSGGAIELLGDHQGQLTIENSGTAGADDTTITILSAGDVTPP